MLKRDEKAHNCREEDQPSAGSEKETVKTGKSTFRYKRIGAVVLLLAFPAVSLSGCRDSTAFTQNIYNQESTEVVEGNMMDNDEENEEERDDIWSVTEAEDTESERDYDRTIAQYGESEEETEDLANNVTYNSRASNLYKSGQAIDPDSFSLEESIAYVGGDTTSEGDVEQTYSTDGEEEDEEGASEADDSTIDDVESDDSLTANPDYTDDVTDVTEEAPDTSDDAEDDDDSDITEVDSGADVEEIPTGITAAAVGDIAVMVQMLGGEDVLVAADDGFETENVSGISAYSVFSDELPDDFVLLGDIDGFEEISSSDFKKLVAAEPDLIFVEEGDSFTSKQETKLENAGTKIIYMQDMSVGDSASETSSDYLMYNLQVIAEALGDRSEYDGQDAEDVYNDYVEWYESIISASETESTLYTCLFTYYDDDVDITVKCSSGNSKGGTTVSVTFDGMPIASSGSAYLAFGDYMEYAGVSPVNVRTNNQAWFTSGGTRAYLIYFMPYITNYISRSASGGLYDSGSVFLLNSAGNDSAGSDPYPLTKVSTSIFLGDEAYNILLTSTQYIQDKIEDSRDNQGIFSGYYDADYFDSTTSEIMAVTSFDFDVYTVPCGVTEWTEGCVESPLLTAWISEIFYGTYDDDDLIALEQEFYETFYRYDLSESKAASILAGKEK